MTENQRVKALQRAEKKLSRCGGDCQHCEKLHLYTADNGRMIVYAFGCDLLPAELFDAISNTVSGLHKVARETVNFELGGYDQ